MKEQAGEQFLAVARILGATEERSLFRQTEFDIRDQFLKLTGQAYAVHLAQKKTAFAGHPSTARGAPNDSPFHGYREQSLQSLGGVIGCKRAYNYCRQCGAGFVPWDEHVGLTERTRLCPDPVPQRSGAVEILLATGLLRPAGLQLM